MRAFAHLPEKRRVAGAIAFALMILSALGAVHHHRIAVAADAAAFTTTPESDTGRTADCLVCRTLVSGREQVVLVSAPHLAVAQAVDTPGAAPVATGAFRPSAPRAPPAA